MAIRREKIRPELKKQLLKEAGDKCANPGCSIHRTHIHHIKEWAVYHTHDEKEMIAVCPTCHDAIHHGRLEISDSKLYKWKTISRKGKGRESQLYIEPGDSNKILLGTINVQSNWDVSLIYLSDKSKLSFYIIDDDLIKLNINISDLAGSVVLTVVDNQIRRMEESIIDFMEVPGHIKVVANDLTRFLPDWSIMKMEKDEIEVKPINFPILELEVLEPGLVKVGGIWVSEKVVFVSNDASFRAVTKAAIIEIQSEVDKEGNSGASFIYKGKNNTGLFNHLFKRIMS